MTKDNQLLALIAELEERDAEMYGELLSHTSPIRKAINFLKGIDKYINGKLDGYHAELKDANESLQYMDDSLGRMEAAYDKEVSNHRASKKLLKECKKATRNE